MSKIKLAFDVGNSALKIALWRGRALELHEVPLPENLVEDDSIAMPHAFSSFLRSVRRELGRLAHTLRRRRGRAHGGFRRR